MIELVVFDMAGTTVYDGDAVSICFRAALGKAGVEIDPAEVTVVMGLPKPEAIRRLLGVAGRDASEEEIATIHADFVQRMRHYYATDPSIREIPGTADAFARLHQAGIQVALNTGFSREIVDVLLDRLGWRPPLIDAVVTSDEVPRGRPFPDMIRHLMDRLGIQNARNVAKVGDTWADLEEGHNAGCGMVIGVTSGSFTRARLQERPHTQIVESVAEVVGVLLPRSEE